MKIVIKDSKTLKDSIDALKKKFKDADIDLTKEGIDSIANALLAKKEDISATSGFAGLRDLVKEVVGKFNTPKSNEILRKVDEFDRLYQRDPRPGQRNDYWMWEKLLKYVWNIILKASGNPSPDVKEQKEDSCSMKDEKKCKVIGENADSREVVFEGTYEECEKYIEAAEKEDAEMYGEDNPDTFEYHIEDSKVKDEEGSLDKICRLLGEAHDKIMEALDLVEDLENEGMVNSALRYDLEDLEADASELDFTGEGDPKAALAEKYAEEESEEYPDEDESYDFGEDD